MTMLNGDLGLHAARARHWLTESAFPLWLERGVDWKYGGFYDALDFAHALNASERKRLRVATRQIYVFCEAAALACPRAREAVEHGLEFLFAKARHREGGFASHFDLDGRQTAPTRDTYDLAFVVFALAHAFRLLGDSRLAQEAIALFKFLDRELRHPSGGFAEGLPAQWPRRQNPHMHLLEACLAWVPLDRTGVFRALAQELVALFAARFLDPRSGAIFEYVDETMRRDPAVVREAVEPGHLFEWVYLLEHYNKITGEPVDFIETIYGFAHAHGIDGETGLLFGEISSTGRVQEKSVRLWPHAEWCRAEIAWLRRNPASSHENSERAFAALWRFLDTGTGGLWFERFDGGSNAFLAGPAPATSLYHITGAFMELIAWDSNASSQEPAALDIP